MKKKIALWGVFTALALIFSYVETLIPNMIGIPGIKLGLANLLIVFMLYKQGVKEAGVLSLVRILLSGALFGSLFSILYSLVGAIFSIVIMWLLKRANKFSVVGISMAGGVAHNIGQLVVACVVLESMNIAYYIPVLMVSGVLTGIVIGVLSNELIKRLQMF